MADTREKLIELMAKADKHRDEICVGHGCESCAYEQYDECGNQIKAEYLIANGVTLATDNNVGGKTECEYCQQFDDPWDAPMIAKEDDEPDRGIYLYNGFLCANGGEFVDAKVNFCPMCGRKLAEPPKGE